MREEEELRIREVAAEGGAEGEEGDLGGEGVLVEDDARDAHFAQRGELVVREVALGHRLEAAEDAVPGFQDMENECLEIINEMYPFAEDVWEQITSFFGSRGTD